MEKKKLSGAAVRTLMNIADGNTISGIRDDIYKEIEGLIRPSPPCLRGALLTAEGVAVLVDYGWKRDESAPKVYPDPFPLDAN